MQIFVAAIAVLGSAVAAGCLVYPRVALPLTVRLATGTMVCSTLVFLALLFGYATLPVFGVIGLVLVVAALLVRPARVERLPMMHGLFGALVGIYVVVYLVYVAAPEIGPDAIRYHLGLVREYVRLEGFPERIGFYEILPQGIDMLFVPAYGLAEHGGAKAVHFGFLLALLPALRRLGQELGLGPVQADGAAIVFWLAPVLGVLGVSAYTDAALLLFAVTAWLMLLQWRKNGDAAFLVHGALAAGFCYAIKPTFGWVAVLAFVYVVWREKRWRAAVVFAGMVVLAIAPWMIRAMVETGNPVAPFFNHWFPNDVFTEAVDRRLSSAYSAFRPDFSWASSLLDYLWRGGNQGVLGPGFLVLPAALLTRDGRRWSILAVLLLVPWVLNTGTRFLLPAAAVAMIAACRVLPDKAVMGLVVLQSICCFPPILALLQNGHGWKLDEIPVQVVLGRESERDYLLRHIGNYDATELVRQFVPKGAGVFALGPVQEAYLDSPVLVFWHNAQAQKLSDGMVAAVKNNGDRAKAAAAVRRAGYPYVLVTTARDPFSILGSDMVAKPEAWHVQLLGTADNEALFWILK